MYHLEGGKEGREGRGAEEENERRNGKEWGRVVKEGERKRGKEDRGRRSIERGGERMNCDEEERRIGGWKSGGKQR